MDPRISLFLKKHREPLRAEINKEYIARGESVSGNSIHIDVETKRRSRDIERLIAGDGN